MNPLPERTTLSPFCGARAANFRFLDPSVYSRFVSMIRTTVDIFTDSERDSLGFLATLDDPEDFCGKFCGKKPSLD